ncbi:MAG: NfeD family protein [Candidatus Limiplasma sp.]|nr:NfeD family protein [Candidatus Limiplasma sp.]
MIEFITANLPIVICFFVGIALLVAEVFLPGFGIAGISGIILEIVSIVLVYQKHGGLAAMGLMIVTLAVIGITISFSLRSATKGRLSKSPIILTQTEKTAQGYIATSDMDVFLGKEGETTTPLRPTGMADFEGIRLNVVSEGEFIPKGTHVRVTTTDGARVVVRRIAKAPHQTNG